LPAVVVLGVAAAGAAHEVDREVGDNSIKPGEKAGLSLESIEAAVHAKESLLHQVARIVFVANHAERDGKRPPLVPFDQAAECRLVTVLAAWMRARSASACACRASKLDACTPA